MKLSRESRYAVQGLSYLAHQPTGTVVDVAKVAQETDLPAAFLAKIFRKLTLYGVLTSHSGRGYELTRIATKISAAQILEAIEGPDLFERCVFWTDTCSDDHPCPFHPAWKDIRPQITDAMHATTLSDLASEPMVHPARS